MIITKLNGGLGNQLFEYACARNLQLKYNDEMRLDIEGFKRSPRHYSLEHFVLSPDVSVLPEKESRSLIILQAVSEENTAEDKERPQGFGYSSFFNVHRHDCGISW